MRSFEQQVFAFLLHPCLPNFAARWVAEIEFGLGMQEVGKMLLLMLVGQMDLQICTHPLLPSLR